MTTDQLSRYRRLANGERAGRPTILSRMFKMTVLLATWLGPSGCGDPDLPPALTKQAVKFDDVPDAVRAAARKAVPQVNLNEAWKNIDRQGKLHSYEIRGKNAADGKIHEVRVSLTGEILEME